MKKKKKILIFVSIILCAWLVMISTDVILAERDQMPVFCIKIVEYEDGGSKKFVGLLYQVYRVVKLDENNPNQESDYGYHVVPWFYSLDYVKEIVVRDE